MGKQPTPTTRTYCPTPKTTTPAKTSLDGAVGAEARVAKVSPIKSLFERAAAANLKSAAPGGSIAAAPEGEDGKQ